MICSASTNTGMRRSNNQDNFMLRKYTEKTTLCVVCDGMGGAKGGEEASKIAAESFVHTVDQFIIPYLKNRDKQASTSDIKRALAKGVAVANENVYIAAKQSKDHKSMGTTLVGALIIDRNIFAINVGDSRLYTLNGDTIRQITKDHSYVQYLIDMGAMSKEEAENSTHKNIITRAVGTDISVEGDIYTAKLEEGSFLLFCTDGLTNMVDNEEICNIVSNERNPSKLDQVELDLKVRRLIDTANKNGGYDNITAVLIRM
ncbi:MAG: Stp1/IreP family PP2C-type Ser/Thr phosphatase [Clostridia bacterium]|nr:Stp1/IreP family PP2C-type Ser/Thr phosphatase [Clostridia bacterium]